MKKASKDLYITSLEFGVAKLNSGFKISDLLRHLTGKSIGVDMNDAEQSMRFFNFLNNSFSEGNDNRRTNNLDEATERTYFIRPEAYFNYLDYTELKEALKSSREARWYALGAILVTIAVAIIQINSSVELDSIQYEEVKDTIQKVCR